MIKFRVSPFTHEQSKKNIMVISSSTGNFNESDTKNIAFEISSDSEKASKEIELALNQLLSNTILSLS